MQKIRPTDDDAPDMITLQHHAQVLAEELNDNPAVPYDGVKIRNGGHGVSVHIRHDYLIENDVINTIQQFGYDEFTIAPYSDGETEWQVIQAKYVPEDE